MSGIFQATDAQLKYVENESWEAFLAADQQLNAEGYRLIALESSGVGRERGFWGIFTQSAQTDTIIRTLGWPDFVAAKRAMAAEGYLLTTVQAYALNEDDHRFIGVWHRDSTDHKIWKLDSPEGLAEKTEQMAAQQYHLQDVEVYLSPSGLPTYLAIYHYHPLPRRNHVYFTTDEKAFSNDHWQRQHSGKRLIDYEQFNLLGQMAFVAVYQDGDYEQQLLRRQDLATFRGNWEQMEKSNLQLISWDIRD